MIHRGWVLTLLMSITMLIMSTDVQANDIAIDGDISDWTGFVPQQTDWMGDTATPDLVGTDLWNCSVQLNDAGDTLNVLIRTSYFPNNERNPAGEPLVQYCLAFDDPRIESWGAWSYDWQIGIDFDNNFWVYDLRGDKDYSDPSNLTWYDGASNDMTAFSQSTTGIEFSLPLSVIGGATAFRMRPYLVLRDGNGTNTDAIESDEMIYLVPEFGDLSHILTNPYRAMCPGDKLTYAGTESWAGYGRYLEAVAVETVDGVSCLKMFVRGHGHHADPDLDPEWYHAWLAQDVEGNVWLLQLYDAKSGETIAFGKDRPVLHMPADPRVGQRYWDLDGEYKEILGKDEDVSELSTGLGPYVYCIREQWVGDNGADVDTAYLAPTVGSVKEAWNEGGETNGWDLARVERSQEYTTYYIHEWGQEDLSGDPDWTGVLRVTLDGAGRFAGWILEDSEGESGPFTGTYTLAKGLLTLSVGDESLGFRVSPDGETLAGITAKPGDSPEEALRVGVRESSLSELTGTYYIHEWGQEDVSGNPDFTEVLEVTFDGSGGAEIEIVEDSEGETGRFSATYNITGGLLTLNGGELSFRVSRDGETLAGITAKPAHSETEETLRIGIRKSSLSELTGTYYIHEWGQEDVSGDPDFTEVLEVTFNGSGGAEIEIVEDSEGETGRFSATYSITDGLLTLNGGELSFRVSPDGETLAGITAKPGDSAEEILRVGIRDASGSNTEDPRGDLNGDTVLDQTDLNLALQVLAGEDLTGIRADYAASGADVNGDCKIGMEEAVYILERLSGARPR